MPKGSDLRSYKEKSSEKTELFGAGATRSEPRRDKCAEFGSGGGIVQIPWPPQCVAERSTPTAAEAGQRRELPCDPPQASPKASPRSIHRSTVGQLVNTFRAATLHGEPRASVGSHPNVATWRDADRSTRWRAIVSYSPLTGLSDR